MTKNMARAATSGVEGRRPSAASPPKREILRSGLFCLLSLLLCGLPLSAQTPSLNLPGSDGKDYAPLSQVGEQKAIVLFFISPYCPTSNTFLKEMKAIVADYESRAMFYFIHSDAGQKLTDILQHTEMHQIKTPVLLDKEQKLATLMQAKITPEAVVLTPDGKTTLYQGRINDLYLGPTKRQRQATTRYLRDALDAVLAGRAITTAKTEPMGCKISGMK